MTTTWRVRAVAGAALVAGGLALAGLVSVAAAGPQAAPTATVSVTRLTAAV